MNQSVVSIFYLRLPKTESKKKKTRQDIASANFLLHVVVVVVVVVVAKQVRSSMRSKLNLDAFNVEPNLPAVRFLAFQV